MWNLTTLSLSASSRRCCISAIEAACLWDMKCTSYGTGGCTPSKDWTDTNEWRRNNCSCQTIDIQTIMLYTSQEPWVSQPNVVEVLRDVIWSRTNYSRNAHLLPVGRPVHLRCVQQQDAHVLIFDNLRHVTAMCNSRTKRLRTYILQHFRIYF